MAPKLYIEELELQLELPESLLWDDTIAKEFVEAIQEAFSNLKIPNHINDAILNSLTLDLGLISSPRDIVPIIRKQLEASWSLFPSTSNNPTQNTDSPSSTSPHPAEPKAIQNQLFRSKEFQTHKRPRFFSFPGKNIKEMEFPISFFIKVWEQHLQNQDFSHTQSIEILSFLGLTTREKQPFEQWLKSLNSAQQKIVVQQLFNSFTESEYANFSYAIWLEKIFLIVFEGSLERLLYASQNTPLFNDVKRWAQFTFSQAYLKELNGFSDTQNAINRKKPSTTYTTEKNQNNLTKSVNNQRKKSNPIQNEDTSDSSKPSIDYYLEINWEQWSNSSNTLNQVIPLIPLSEQLKFWNILQKRFTAIQFTEIWKFLKINLEHIQKFGSHVQFVQFLQKFTLQFFVKNTNTSGTEFLHWIESLKPDFPTDITSLWESFILEYTFLNNKDYPTDKSNIQNPELSDNKAETDSQEKVNIDSHDIQESVLEEESRIRLNESQESNNQRNTPIDLIESQKIDTIIQDPEYTTSIDALLETVKSKIIEEWRLWISNISNYLETLKSDKRLIKLLEQSATFTYISDTLKYLNTILSGSSKTEWPRFNRALDTLNKEQLRFIQALTQVENKNPNSILLHWLHVRPSFIRWFTEWFEWSLVFLETELMQLNANEELAKPKIESDIRLENSLNEITQWGQTTLNFWEPVIATLEVKSNSDSSEIETPTTFNELEEIWQNWRELVDVSPEETKTSVLTYFEVNNPWNSSWILVSDAERASFVEIHRNKRLLHSLNSWINLLQKLQHSMGVNLLNTTFEDLYIKNAYTHWLEFLRTAEIALFQAIELLITSPNLELLEFLSSQETTIFTVKKSQATLRSVLGWFRLIEEEPKAFLYNSSNLISIFQEWLIQLLQFLEANGFQPLKLGELVSSYDVFAQNIEVPNEIHRESTKDNADKRNEHEYNETEIYNEELPISLNRNNEFAFEADSSWFDEMKRYLDSQLLNELNEPIFQFDNSKWQDFIRSFQPLNLTQWYSLNYLQRLWEKNQYNKLTNKDDEEFHKEKALATLWVWFVSHIPEATFGNMSFDIKQELNSWKQHFTRWITEEESDVISQLSTVYEEIIQQILNLKEKVVFEESMVEYQQDNRDSKTDTSITQSRFREKKKLNILLQSNATISFDRVVAIPQVWLFHIANNHPSETSNINTENNTETNTFSTTYKRLSIYQKETHKKLWFKELRKQKGKLFYQLAQTLTTEEVVDWVKDNYVFQWDFNQIQLTETFRFVRQEFGIAAAFKSQQFLKYRLILLNKPLTKIELTLLIAEELRSRVSQMSVAQLQKLMVFLRQVFSLSKLEFERFQSLFNEQWSSVENEPNILNKYSESTRVIPTNISALPDISEWLTQFIYDHPLLDPSAIKSVLLEQLKEYHPQLNSNELNQVAQNWLKQHLKITAYELENAVSSNFNGSPKLKDWFKVHLEFWVIHQKKLPLFSEILESNNIKLTRLITQLPESFVREISENISYLHPKTQEISSEQSGVTIIKKRATQSEPIAETEKQIIPFNIIEKSWTNPLVKGSVWLLVHEIEKIWTLNFETRTNQELDALLFETLFKQQLFHTTELQSKLEQWLYRVITSSIKINITNETPEVLIINAIEWVNEARNLFKKEDFERNPLFLGLEYFWENTENWLKEIVGWLQEILEEEQIKSPWRTTKQVIKASLERWFAELTLNIEPSNPEQWQLPKSTKIPLWFDWLFLQQQLQYYQNIEPNQVNVDLIQLHLADIKAEINIQRNIIPVFWMENEYKLVSIWGNYRVSVLKQLSLNLGSKLPDKATAIIHWLELWLSQSHLRATQLVTDFLIEPLLRWSIEAGWEIDSRFSQIKPVIAWLIDAPETGEFPKVLNLWVESEKSISSNDTHEHTEKEVQESAETTKEGLNPLEDFSKPIRLNELLQREIDAIAPETLKAVETFIERTWTNKLQFEQQAFTLLTSSEALLDTMALPMLEIKEVEAKRNENKQIKRDIEAGVRFRTQYCGLMLIAPFYATLFKRLNLLENQQFLSDKEQITAYQTVIYLTEIDSELPQSEVQDLIPRIIAGIPAESEIYVERPLSTDQKDEIKRFLTAVKMQWPLMARMSLRGFIESFLLRGGTAYKGNDGSWNIDVDGLGSDIIMQTLPWGYATMKFPWTSYLVYTTWKVP